MVFRATERLTHSIAVVGNDAVLEALPSHPIQLAHACLKAGYAMAVPASWGDELVAEEALRRLAQRGDEPAILCTCPRVRERLFHAGVDLARFVLSLVPPSVAVARYLRAIIGRRGLRLVYVGSCAGGSDGVYDAHFLPGEFLAHLHARGISTVDQPRVFESIVPPDRRRFLSMPGGCPTPEAVAQRHPGRSVVVLEGQELTSDLAQSLLSRQRVLIDVSTRLGCECSGMVGSASVASARIAVTSLEPPRATASIVDSSVPIVLDAPIAAPSRAADLGRALPVFPKADQPDEAGHSLSVEEIERERVTDLSALLIEPSHELSMRESPGRRPIAITPEGSVVRGSALHFGRSYPERATDSFESREPVDTIDRASSAALDVAVHSVDEEVRTTMESGDVRAPSHERRHTSGSFRAVRARRREGSTVPRTYFAKRRGGSATVDTEEQGAWPSTDRERELDVAREPLTPGRSSAVSEDDVLPTSAVDTGVTSALDKSLGEPVVEAPEATRDPTTAEIATGSVEAPHDASNDQVPDTQGTSPSSAVSDEESAPSSTHPEPLRVYVEEVEEVEVGPPSPLPSERHREALGRHDEWSSRVRPPDERSAVRTAATVAFLTALALVALYLMLGVGR
jgi:hypothetical protein